MPRMHQEVKIKKDIDVPRLKGRLRPIIMAPARAVIKPFVKDKLPLYIDPLPLKPIIPKAVEPPLKEQIEEVIPLYIGDPDEQQKTIHKAPADEPAAGESREAAPTVEDTPRTL